MKNEDLIKEYCDKLVEVGSNTDNEEAHIEADSLLCELLNKLGFKEVVWHFEIIDKWYA